MENATSNMSYFKVKKSRDGVIMHEKHNTKLWYYILKGNAVDNSEILCLAFYQF